MKKTKLERASLCVECGPNVRVDEDGCCAACGASAMGPWADKAVAVLRAQAPSAVQRAERAVVRAAVRFAAHPGVHPRQGEEGEATVSDLEAAVARLKRDLDAIAAETSGAKEARGDVRLLLADWERLREMTSPAAGLARLKQELGIMDKTIAERDAARAEVERLQGLLTVTDAALVRTVEQARKAEAGAKFGAGLAQDLSGELARLRERDAQVRSILQRVDDEACKTDWSGNPDDLPESRPLDNEAVAMDMREALELLKETP